MQITFCICTLMLQLLHILCLAGGVSGIDLQDPELEEAATRIQASYRGYATRKTIKMSNAEEEVDIDLNDPGKKLITKT